MPNTKIIFFDIDGTLVDMQRKKITDRMLETLKRLKENGILICIATGRGPLTLPYFEGIDFDAFLTFNGSYCYNHEGTIFSNPLKNEDVHRLIRNATGLGRPVSIATGSRMAANGKDDDLVEYYGFANQEVEVADDFEIVADTAVYQVMMGCRKEDYPEILKDVEAAKITSWWERAVDIIPIDGGKGMGIEKMLGYYHLDKSQALAFGDGNNDIEMLQTVGCGVAMANASDELKTIADDCCGHVAEDGIYHYCVEHGLIETF